MCDDNSSTEAVDIRDELYNRRTVVLADRIERGSVQKVMRDMITLQIQSSDHINLLIDSPGGDVNVALMMCDFMSLVLKAPVHGIALGMCGSAATFVMLHCDKKLSLPHAEFLIHSGTRHKISVPINESTSENLEQLLREVKRTEEMLVRLYAEKLKMGSDEVRRLIMRGDQYFDRYLSPEDAQEIGLIDDIVQSKLDIF